MGSIMMTPKEGFERQMEAFAYMRLCVLLGAWKIEYLPGIIINFMSGLLLLLLCLDKSRFLTKDLSHWKQLKEEPVKRLV